MTRGSQAGMQKRHRSKCATANWQRRREKHKLGKANSQQVKQISNQTYGKAHRTGSDTNHDTRGQKLQNNTENEQKNKTVT